MKRIMIIFAFCLLSFSAFADPGDYLSTRQVMEVQERLGLSVDGVYGPNTAAAVARFQRRRGLYADGEAGPKTLAELFESRRDRREERRSERDDRCKREIEATGEGRPTRTLAFGSAREVWQLEVRGRYGAEWGVWDNAKSEPEKCYTLGGVMWKRWQCRVSASPCSE